MTITDNQINDIVDRVVGQLASGQSPPGSPVKHEAAGEKEKPRAGSIS